MKKYYQNKPKSGVKQSHPATKDDIIEQLQARIKEQAATIELLKQQLTIKDEQIAKEIKKVKKERINEIYRKRAKEKKKNEIR